MQKKTFQKLYPAVPVAGGRILFRQDLDPIPKPLQAPLHSSCTCQDDSGRFSQPGPLQTHACFIVVLSQGSATSGQLRSDFWLVLVDSWQGYVPRFYPWGLETGQETPVSLQVGTPGMGQPALMPGARSHQCALGCGAHRQSLLWLHIPPGDS